MTVLPFQRDALIEAARAARQKAYAPYSNFLVGSAVLGADGEIFSGANVENASYGLAVCAERNAVNALVFAGERSLAAVAVASENGVTPCGACRQVLREFGGDIPVWIVNDSTGEIRETSLGRLLPDSFTGEQLLHS